MLLFFFFPLLYKQEIQRYVYLYRRRVSAVRGNVCACLREKLARGLEKKRKHPPSSLFPHSLLSLSLPFSALPARSFKPFFILLMTLENNYAFLQRLCKSYSYLLLCRPNTNPFIIRSLTKAER